MESAISNLHRLRATRLSARLLIALSAAGVANAAALTWDSDIGTSGAQDGAGTWSTGTGGWWNGSANANWTAGDTAIFGAAADGTYAVTVSGAITTGLGTTSVGGIHFANSGYTLSASSLSTIKIGNANNSGGYLSVASGKSATVGTNVKITGHDGVGSESTPLFLFGGGTLNIVGSAAEVRTGSNNLSIYGGTTVNVGAGGTLSGANSQIIIGTSSGNGTVVVNGGTMYSPVAAAGAQNFVLANNNAAGSTVSGTLTIEANGLVSNPKTNGGLRFGSSTNNTGATAISTSTLNLNGGTLEIGYLFSGTATGVTRNSTVNFNGGTLKVLTGSTNAGTFMTGLSNAFVKDGGAIIDTNGVAATIGQALVHGGAAATDGGLTKQGTQTLTLTGTNTYTGPTTVSVGGLTVSGSIANTASISVATGATFTNNGSSLSKGISLGEGATIAGTGGVSATSLTISANLTNGFAAIVAGSNFTKGSSLSLTLSGITDGSYSLFSSSVSGAFGSISVGSTALSPVSGGFGGTIDGFNYTFTTASDVLTIAAIPEPANYASVFGAFVLAGAGLRRSSRRS